LPLMAPMGLSRLSKVIFVLPLMVPMGNS
jgi:hypothetical protein